MVVTPFDALEDVGYTWQQWGGAWSSKDPVHFELPGAAAEARRLGEASLPDPIGSVIHAANELPWYVQLLTPWQLTVYQLFPSLQTLIDPAWPIQKIRSIISNFARP